LDGKKKEFSNNVNMYFSYMRVNMDSVQVPAKQDSAFKAHLAIIRGDTLSPESKTRSISRALSGARNVKSFGGAAERDFSYHIKKLRKHNIEWHRKFTLSFACLVMFLIGAPLGAIIRVGGLGYPMLFSIIFFVIFHATSITSEKVAEEGGLTPVTAMWMATFVLLPIGLFLTYKAVNDSPLFTFDWYYRTVKKAVKK
jgi:lipopolysaccharide export system permease protein